MVFSSRPQSLMYLSAPSNAVISPTQAIVTPSFSSSQPSPSAPLTFQCHLCPKVFDSSQALSGDLSRGHRVLHPIQYHLGPYCNLPGLSATCACCLLHFTTRARLLHHLRQCSQTCHDFYIAHVYVKFGTTPLTATVPVSQAPGPIWSPA